MKSVNSHSALRLFFNLSRLAFLGFAMRLLSVQILSTMAAPDDQADLRGYGKVTASIAPSRSEFVCESDAKADILMGKLLADLFWDAGKEATSTTVDVQGKSVTVREWKPYGAIVVARNKNRVLVVGADDVSSITPLLAKEELITNGVAFYQPAAPYPIYLDFFDLRSFKAFSHGTMLPLIYPSRWEFTKQFLSGGLIQHRPYLILEPAEGVWPGKDSIDFDLTAAAKENVMYSLAISTGAWPLWMQNQHPDAVETDSDHSIKGGEYTRYSTSREALALSPEERRATCLKFLKEPLQLYKNNPTMGGYKLYCGNRWGEPSYQLENFIPIDYCAASQEGYRRWLRDVRKYSLAGLGERWYGDANHFKSWNEVSLPVDWNGFYGNLSDKSFLISKNWSWRKADESANANVDGKSEQASTEKAVAKALPTPDASAPGWIPVEWGPSQARAFLPREGDLCYKVSFDADKWRKQNKGKKLYLSCCVNAETNKPGTFVWINGKLAGEFSSTVRRRFGPFSLDVTNQLKQGENTLMLRVPKPAIINGPIFLTTDKPTFYPYWKKEQNARYVDMTEWQVWELDHKVADTMEYVRSIEPDRPLMIPTASSVECEEQQGVACARFGGAMHNTGREAGIGSAYWWPRTGMIGGFYGSSETAGTVRTAEGMSALIGSLLYEGDSNHALFWDVNHYIDLEAKSGWFTQNERLLHLFGKYLPAKPDLVFLRSSRSSTLTAENRCRQWDVGRGELQGSHYDYAYADEGMVERGLVDSYKVLFDDYTEIMDASTVEAIKRYVENGGTFVAMHETGRHGILEADAWPISRLTGFKVVKTGEKGKIHFQNDLPVFKGWEGKEFDGEGTSIDWKNNEDAKNGGISLKAEAPDTVALAKWDDGSVAVGLRKLGKGRVIVLGSTFWRHGKDVKGVWRRQSEIEGEFFDRLFTDLGVERNALASSPDVWTRKVISKNGLQDWLIAFCPLDKPVQSDLALAVSEKPDEVWDLVAKKSVPFEYDNGWVKLKGVDFPALSTKVFGVKRAGLAGGIGFWWDEKTKYWQSAHVPPLVESQPLADANPATIQIDQWKSLADPDGSISATDAWTQNALDDSTWKLLKTGIWNYQDESLAHYKGVVLYRSAPFALPEGWAGHPVTFNVSRNDVAKDYARGEFYLNGKKIGEFNEDSLTYSFKVNVDGVVKKEGNVLSAKVTGNKELSGLSGVVWVERERKFDATIPLDGSWRAIQLDYLTQKPVTLPAKLDAGTRYVRREFEIPSDWKGRSIYLNAEFGNNVVETILINGRPISARGAYPRINLLPYLSANGKNTIEFWKYGTGYSDKAQIDVRKVELAREAK